MLVAGVDLPMGSVAQLALCLSRAGADDIAMHVGIAVDSNQQSLSLSPVERFRIMRMLKKDCPVALLPLRDALAAT